MLKGFPKNSDASSTAALLGQFSKLNTRFLGYWWKLDLSEMPSRRSDVCTVFYANMTDVTRAKEADLKNQALCSTITTWRKVCSRNQNYIRRRPQHWKEAMLSQIDPNTTCRKYKESEYISVVAHHTVISDKVVTETYLCCLVAK
jgi:hypothetical protein